MNQSDEPTKVNNAEKLCLLFYCHHVWFSLSKIVRTLGGISPHLLSCKCVCIHTYSTLTRLGLDLILRLPVLPVSHENAASLEWWHKQKPGNTIWMWIETSFCSLTHRSWSRIREKTWGMTCIPTEYVYPMETYSWCLRGHPDSPGLLATLSKIRYENKIKINFAGFAKIFYVTISLLVYVF